MSNRALDPVPALTFDLPLSSVTSGVQDPSLALGLTFLPLACPSLPLDVGNSTWASFLSRHGSKIMVCEKDPALKNRCHIRYMHLFSTIKYKVSISVSNALGHNATAITFDEFTIGACGNGGGGGSCCVFWERVCQGHA